MPNKIPSHLKKQASLYVLNALSDSEHKKFMALLQSDITLRDFVDELQKTLLLTEKISMKRPTEEYLQSQRNLLRGRIELLQQEKIRRPIYSDIKEKIESVISSLTEIRQPAWAVATYILIAFIIGLSVPGPVGEPTTPTQTTPLDIRQLLESGSLSNADIDISGNDQSAINFALHTNQDVKVSGGLEDESVRQLIYYLLLNDQNPGNRLKAVDLIDKIGPVDDARNVLVSSLLTDQNPGVRLRSVNLLSQFEPDELLINACQKVLLEDKNEAVRMGALSILAKHPTDNIVPLLQVVSDMDENDYIRDQSKKILAELKYQAAAEKIEVIQ